MIFFIGNYLLLLLLLLLFSTNRLLFILLTLEFTFAPSCHEEIHGQFLIGHPTLKPFTSQTLTFESQ